MAKPRRRRFPAIVAALAFVTLLAGLGAALCLRFPHQAPRQQFIFVSGVPALPGQDGFENADLQLRNGAQYGLGLINYNDSLRYAKAPAIRYYDARAEHYGTKLVPSLQDMLAPKYDSVVRATVGLVDSSPAVVRYLVTDENPADPGTSATAVGLRNLAHRCAMMRTLTKKPLMGVFSWGDNHHNLRLHFFQQIEKACPGMILGVDFYPWPDSSLLVKTRYGQIDPSKIYDNILEIARVLHAVAGDYTWFVVQAFGWGNHEYNSTAKKFGFPPGSPPPNAAVMLRMIQWALYGGVRDIAFYSYEYAGTTVQLWQIGIASHGATQLPGY